MEVDNDRDEIASQDPRHATPSLLARLAAHVADPEKGDKSAARPKWYQRSQPTLDRAAGAGSCTCGFSQSSFTNVGRAADFMLLLGRRPTGTISDFRLGLSGDGYRLAGSADVPGAAENFQTQARPGGGLSLAASNSSIRTRKSLSRLCRRDKSAQSGRVSDLRCHAGIFQSPLRFRDYRHRPAPMLVFNDAKTYPQLYDTESPRG